MTRFYAVQVGDNNVWDYGSSNYSEATIMAETEAANHDNDGMEIRIAYIDEDANYCDEVETIREGKGF